MDNISSRDTTGSPSTASKADSDVSGSLLADLVSGAEDLGVKRTRLAAEQHDDSAKQPQDPPAKRNLPCIRCWMRKLQCDGQKLRCGSCKSHRSVCMSIYRYQYMATRVAQQAPGLATASPALVSSKRCPPLTDSELEEFQACVRSLPAKHRSNHHPTLRPQAHEPMPVDQPAIPSPASHSKAPSDTTHNASMGKVSNSSPGLSNGATTGRRLREDIALLRELREQRILLREAMKCRAEEKRTRTPITRKQIAPSLLTTFLKDGDSTEGGSHGKEFARSLNAQSPRNDEGCDARWQALARKTLADVEYATVALLNVLSHFEDQLPLEVSFAIERLKTAAKKRYSRRTATRAFAQFVLEWNKFPDLSRKIAVQLDGRWEFGGWAVRMQNWIGQTHGMRYFEFDGAKMAVAIEHENRAFLKAHCPTYQWVVASWIGRLAMYCMQCDNDRKGVAKMNPDMVFPPPSFLAWARWQCDLEEEPDVLEALRN